MSIRVFTAYDFRPLEDELIRRIDAVKASDPLAPVYILAGSNLAGRYLNDLLSHRMGGVFNVGIMTFPDLVSLVAESAGIECPLTLPPFSGRIVIEGMRRRGEIPRYFESISMTDGFPEAVLGTLTDIDEAGFDAAIAKNLSGKRDARAGTRDLLDIYMGYRDRIARIGGDIHSFFRDVTAAAGSLDTGPSIFVYGFYDMNELQYRFLSSISGWGGIDIFIPVDGEEESLSGRFVSRLKDSGFDHTHLDREKERPGGKKACLDGKKTNRLTGPAREVFSAHDPESEIREIASRVLDLAGRSIRFGEMALLIPPGYDESLVGEIFDEALIPCYMSGHPFLELSAHARTLLSLAGLMVGVPSRSRLVDLLASIPLNANGDTNGHPDPFSVWIRVSAESGMTGENGWVEENVELIDRLERKMDEKDGDRDLVDAVRRSGEVIENIMALSKVDRTASWSDRVEALSGVAAWLLGKDEESRAVLHKISGLVELDRIDRECPARVFCSVLKDLLSRPAGAAGRFGGEGVNILPLSAARGLRFRAVFIPGLTEDALPGRTGRDPFLSDEGRETLERLSGSGVRFSRRQDRPGELRHIFDLACRSAGEYLFHSFPRNGEGTDREKIPSSFLDPESGEDAVQGGSGDIAAEGRVPVTRVPCGPVHAWSREPISEEEFSLLSVFRCGEKAGELFENMFFAKGLRLSSSRWKKSRLSAYDGIIGSKEGLSALRSMLDSRTRVFSPTSLERWAGCPFVYFLNDILGVESVEEPEEMISIDPLRRGIVVHSIMEVLYGELNRKKLLPLTAENRGVVLEAVARVSGDTLERFASREPVGLKMFWEVEKRMIIQSVIGYIESEIREQDGMIPIEYESAFGFGPDGVDVVLDTGKRSIHFRGRIDRIDRDPSSRFRVIDYKTGKLDGRKDNDLGGGVYLQLPVYLLAAARMLGLDIGDGVAQYRKVAPGGGRRVVTFSGEDWEEMSRQLGDVVDVITSGMEGGLFFISPDKQGCRFCGLSSACPSMRGYILEEKVMKDDRCRAYISMRRGEAEGEG
ncbi:MAG: PD-(D/E)XK nuclease family protein [Candidatus Krumholzibacteria bacterium]|nr:PD-(D/E)XK nuclease family protein [Candidatus Krumholzibacteria bacterium]